MLSVMFACGVKVRDCSEAIVVCCVRDGCACVVEDESDESVIYLFTC